MNGISKERVVLPVLTPERAEKRQNGRRFKEDGEEAFTLTAQDIHGVAISVDDNIDNSSKCICILDFTFCLFIVCLGILSFELSKFALFLF